MKYSDPFAITQSSPLSRTLRFIELQKNMQLNWPEAYEGPDYIASINEINPAANGFTVTLPDAREANVGTGMLMANVGAYRIVLNSYASVELTDLEPGEVKYLYCSDNSTSGGTWRITGFGTTTSGADAAALAGPGTSAIGGRLATARPVTISTSNVVLQATDRGKVFTASAGSVAIQLPPYTVGNDFFVGVKNGGSGSVTVTAPSGTIDGYSSFVLAPNESAEIVCSGTSAWYTLGYGRSTEFQFTKLVKEVTAGGSITLTSAEASNKLMQFIGSPASNVTIIVPAVVGIYFIQNAYSGPNSLTVKTALGTGIALASTSRAILYCDGLNIVAAQSAAVGTNISVIDGSLGAPSISFAADPNSGIYRADVDTVGVASDGTDAARFHKDKTYVRGKLGIATNDPAAQLHVDSGANEAVRVQGSGATLTWWNTAGTSRFGYSVANTATVAGVTFNTIQDFIEGDGERSVAINGVTRFRVTKDGIVVNGTVKSDDSTTEYAGLGANTFTGVQQLPAERLKFLAFGNLAAGTRNIDLAVAGTFSAVLAGIVNFTFSNKPPAGYDQTTYLKLTNGAQFPPNWPAGTKHPRGVKPVLSAGSDLLAIWYDPELQAHVVGTVWPDFK